MLLCIQFVLMFLSTDLFYVHEGWSTFYRHGGPPRGICFEDSLSVWVELHQDGGGCEQLLQVFEGSLGLVCPNPKKWLGLRKCDQS